MIYNLNLMHNINRSYLETYWNNNISTHSPYKRQFSCILSFTIYFIVVNPRIRIHTQAICYVFWITFKSIATKIFYSHYMEGRTTYFPCCRWLQLISNNLNPRRVSSFWVTSSEWKWKMFGLKQTKQIRP